MKKTNCQKVLLFTCCLKKSNEFDPQNMLIFLKDEFLII